MAAATSVRKRGVARTMRYGIPWRGILVHGASIVFILWIVLPFAWVVLTSLMTEAESLSVPPHWIPDYITFDNYLAFVDPATEHVHPGAERMAVESDHSHRVAYRPKSCGSEDLRRATTPWRAEARVAA